MIPHNPEAERSLIGAMLTSPDAIDDVVDRLAPSDFFDQQHTRTFETILELYAQGKPADTVTVRKLTGQDADLFTGEHGYLASFTRISAAREHAGIIRDAAVMRNLIQFSERLRDKATPTANADEILEWAESDLFKIADRTLRSEPLPLSRLVGPTLEAVEQGEDQGIPTGFDELDGMLGGFRPGEFIIVGARTSVGKSALLANFALNVSRTTPTVLFSLEMSRRDLTQRFLSQAARVPLKSIRTGQVPDWKKLSDAGVRLNATPLFIDDSESLSIVELRAKCRRLKARHDIGLVCVDYLQLMRADSGDNREQQVSSLTRGLKSLARSLQVPVIAAAQVNRNPENREDKRPRLGDLRESGGLEMDSDVVLLLHRPGMHDHTKDPKDTELIVAKQRNGQTGTVALHFEKDFASFSSVFDGRRVA